MIKHTIYFFLLVTMVLSCGGGDDYTYVPIGPELPGNGSGSDDDGEPTISDEELLDLVQEETFKFFWDFAEEHSGAAKERYHPNDPGRDANVVTTGGTGFGLMAILVAVERGFVSRSEAVERLGSILDFLGKRRSFSWSLAPLDQWVHGDSDPI